MKNRFLFFGIKAPERVRLVREFVGQNGVPKNEDFELVVLGLWRKPERECQYAALDVVARGQKQLTPGAVGWIEELIVTKPWWDTCDALSSPILAKLFQKFPGEGGTWIERWRASDDIWLRRTALLYQRAYRAGTDVPLLFSLIVENAGSKEFFIQKAIGWALREYSKTNPEAIIKFVNETNLPPLSRREALKWISRDSVG